MSYSLWCDQDLVLTSNCKKSISKAAYLFSTLNLRHCFYVKREDARDVIVMFEDGKVVHPETEEFWDYEGPL